MRTATERQVRVLLRRHTDGMTIPELIEALKSMDGVTRTEHNLRRTIRSMPDSYIDRWELRPRKVYAAVWCVVTPPEDCPKPNT